jgi:two-component system LytT family response regulator
MSARVLIVDDEAVARRRVRRYLAADPQMSIVGECADGAAAVQAIATLAPDLVFLDVQMPELDGFSVLAALPPASLPAVIFVTAFDRYALRAFDLHAIDYLLKPFSKERFSAALDRAKAHLAGRERDSRLTALLEQLRHTPRAPSRVAVPSGDRLVVISWSSVDWIEAADNYVKLHAGAAEHLLRQTLAALEKELEPAEFVRIHRSAMVRIDRIAELFPESHGDFTVRLRDGTRLPMSRTFREKVERAIRWTR